MTWVDTHGCTSWQRQWFFYFSWKLPSKAWKSWKFCLKMLFVPNYYSIITNTHNVCSCRYQKDILFMAISIFFRFYEIYKRKKWIKGEETVTKNSNIQICKLNHFKGHVFFTLEIVFDFWIQTFWPSPLLLERRLLWTDPKKIQKSRYFNFWSKILNDGGYIVMSKVSLKSL
jgi:hypothetical protein